MSNAFIVLVSLCIGLAVGFIVPSGDSEISLTSGLSRKNNEDKNVVTTETGRVSELPNNRTDIDEKALYENADTKENKQNERAFIYINQKYRKPSLHQFFKLAQNGPEFTRSFHQPPPIPQAIIQPLNEPCKSDSAQINSYFHGYDFLDRPTDIASYFAPPSLYNCNVNDVDGKNPAKVGVGDADKLHNKMANEQRDYIELLKSPLVRPLSRGTVKAKYDGSPGQVYSNVNKNVINQYKNQNKPKENILVDERKNELRKTFGFSPPYIHPAYRSKALSHRLDLEGEFVNSNDGPRLFDKIQDDDKLLDQYLKDSLEDQVTSKENAINANDCSYRECLLQSTKTSSSFGDTKISIKPDCKCGHQSKTKQPDGYVTKDRLERQDTKLNKTNGVFSPSELSYFEELLTEESNNRKRASPEKS